MFVKYQIKGGIADDNYQALNSIFADLRDIMNGTITSASSFNSSFCDVSSSEMVGSVSSTIYHTVTYTAAGSSAEDVFLRFFKRHHSYATNTTRAWERNFLLIGSVSAGRELAGIMRNKSSTNGLPNNAATGAAANVGDANREFQMYLSDAPTIYIMLSDSFVYFNFINESLSYGAVLGMNDYEKTAADDHIYDNYTTNHCPTYLVSFCNRGNYNRMLYNSTGVNNEYFYVGMNDYLDNGGQINTQIGWNTTYDSYIYGWSQTDELVYPQTFPKLRDSVFHTELASGDKGHQLIPIYITAHQNDFDDSNPIVARLYNIWRTTDDIGYPGQTITFNSQDYIVLMMHKTGGAGHQDTDQYQNSCYLVPKTIGGN